MIHIRFVLVLVFLLALLPAAAQPAIDLSEQYTYTTEDGQLSLRYPAGWTLENYAESDFLYLFLSSDADAASRELSLEGLKPGQVQIDLLIDLLNAFDIKDLDLGTEDLKQIDVQATLEEILALSGNEGSDFVDSEITTVLINGLLVAQATRDYGERGRAEYIFSLREQNERSFLVGLTLRTASDELDQWRPVALAVLESITVSEPGDGESAESTAAPAPALPLTETTSLVQFGQYTLRYPAQWVSRMGERWLYLATSRSAVDRGFGASFEPGEAQLYVEIASLADLETMVQTRFNEDDDALDVLQRLIDIATAEIARGGPRFSVSDLVAIEFNGAPAATGRISGQIFEGIVWVVQYEPGVFLLGQLLTAPSEADQWQATAEAVLASVTHSGDETSAQKKIDVLETN